MGLKKSITLAAITLISSSALTPLLSTSAIAGTFTVKGKCAFLLDQSYNEKCTILIKKGYISVLTGRSSVEKIFGQQISDFNLANKTTLRMDENLALYDSAVPWWTPWNKVPKWVKNATKKTNEQHEIAINSGANLNFDRLGHIVERVQLGENKEALLAVKIPEEKGSFRRFCRFLGKRMISEFNLATKILEEWNCEATKDSVGACIFYPFLDRFWQRKFMHEVLGDDLINILPLGAPGLNRFDIGSFLKDKFWKEHESSLQSIIEEEIKTVVGRVKNSLGDDPSKWRWGDLHKIQFKHSLNKFNDWQELQLGPDEIGGSPTTLGMAMHMGKGPGKVEKNEIPCRVYHGPAYRLVVDLNDPEHAKFVIEIGRAHV